MLLKKRQKPKIFKAKMKIPPSFCKFFPNCVEIDKLAALKTGLKGARRTSCCVQQGNVIVK